MAGFTTADLKSAAVRLAAAGEAMADELNAQDARLGDGDLGITIAAGWQAVANATGSFSEDVGAAFLAAAKEFQRVSSSSFGTLTATAFIAAAKATKGRREVPWSEVANLVSAARDAMMARGKAAIGDKTILDSLDAIACAVAGADEPRKIAAAAAGAAEKALADFQDKPNRIGRARMFSQSSVGLADPGMLAAARIAAALARQ